MKRWWVFLLIALALGAHAQTVSDTEKMRVLRQLGERDYEKRAAARAVLRLAGTNMAAAAQVPLAAAKESAIKALRVQAPHVNATSKNYQDVAAALKTWQDLATPTLEMIRTDLHKDGAKLKELGEKYADTEKAYQRVLRFLKRGDFADVAASVQQMKAAEADLLWCKDGGTIDSIPVVAVEGVQFDAAIKPLLKSIGEILAREELHAAIAATHDRWKWAKPEIREFAAILNGRRVAVGIRPLLLAERLSEAAADHSDEMIKLGYFAHESPVEKNKTPWDRARNAQFEGDAAGENIFAGSEAPGSAFGGWWGSDGHRIIMFGDGINATGVGRRSGHWTMMTGSFKKFPM